MRSSRSEPTGNVDHRTASKADQAETEVNGAGSTNSSDIEQSESVNVWPDEAAESAFLAESRGEENLPVKPEAAANRNDDEPTAPLPKLDELVNRIPAEARELLEELFRAKFTTVRRVKKSDLKAHVLPESGGAL